MSESRYPYHPVLLIDDALPSLLTMKELLEEAGITHTLTCNDSREVERLLMEQSVSLILLDLCMPHINGEDLIPLIKRFQPEIPIIITTVTEDAEVVVRCIKKGAYDYLIKHKLKTRIQTVIQNALEVSELRQTRKSLEKKILAPHIEQPEFFSHIITCNPAMYAIFEYIEAVSRSSETVLVTGESGTGKECLAKAIHKASGRKGEFVAVNVAALDNTQFTDTLFGHGAGAFTDAKGPRKGLVELAQGGTLFIDEIADVSLDAQQKLLRFLEEKEYRPLGIDHVHFSNAKVIAATNKNIQQLIKLGQFRHDLFYRLNTHAIQIPPLRERKEDIPLLINFFAEKTALENNLKVPAVPDAVCQLLTFYAFPGNVRELRSLIIDAVITNKTGELSVRHFKTKLSGLAEISVPEIEQPVEKIAFPKTLPTIKKTLNMLIKEALSRVKNNRKMAAQMLGITRQALERRLNTMKD